MADWHPGIPHEYHNQIVAGDARGLAKRLPDESVDLIFTDPVYQNTDDYRWLAETAARILRPDGNLLAYSGMTDLDAVLSVMRKHIGYRWVFIERKTNTKIVIWKYGMFSQTRPLLWFGKATTFSPEKFFSSFRTKTSGGKGNYKWYKDARTTMAWMAVFPGMVLDPFTGGGTVPAVCKMLGRNFIAFEIDPDTAALARQRLRETPEPLFVLEPQPQQAALL